jgi:hypothetical protein
VGGPGTDERTTAAPTVLALAALGLLALMLVASGRVPSALPLLGPDCTAAAGGDEVGLSREVARSVTQLAAVAVRDGVDEQRVAAAVRQVRDGDGAALDPASAAAALAGTPPEPAPEPADLALARAVLGFEQGALTCSTSRPDRVGEPPGADGLTPRAQRLRAELEAAFGPQSLGGFAPGGVSEGHIEGSAHYEGRAIDVFFRPVTEPGTRRGWAVSHWLVAHAAELDVATVIFDRQIWSAGRSREGWRPYVHPSGDTGNPVLAHEDHVHVDVGR